MKKLFYFSTLMLFCINLKAQQIGSLTDPRDSKTYKTVLMESGKKGDKKTWMAENLTALKFRNGDPITESKTYDEWLKNSLELKPTYCYYNFDSKNQKFGVLYNYYALKDKRGLAPKGWRIANIEDWQSIMHYGEYELEDGNFANNHVDLMSVDWNKFYYSHSDENEINPTNKSGFNAIPNGVLANGLWLPIVYESCWWAVDLKKDEAYSIRMSAEQPFLHFYPELKPGSINVDIYQSSFSVRCVKE